MLSFHKYALSTLVLLWMKSMVDAQDTSRLQIHVGLFAALGCAVL